MTNLDTVPDSAPAATTVLRIAAGRQRAHPPRDAPEPDRHHRAPQDVRHPLWVLAARQHGDLALLATSAVILFVADAELTYSSFVTAIGVPMTVVLPVIAILSVTGERSQRSGLPTFTLVPHRGRVIAAKAISSVGVAVVTIPVAFAIGALGNVVGTAIAGVDAVWDLAVSNTSSIRSCSRRWPCCSPPRGTGSTTCSLGRLQRRAGPIAGRHPDLWAVGPPRGHRRDLARRPLAVGLPVMTRAEVK